MSEERSNSKSSAKPATKKRRWVSTVYDSVASRVSYEGFIKPAVVDEHGETKSRSGKAMPADEVLGQRKRAPDEVYNVSQAEGLPESDLLVAVHQYASDYYHLTGQGEINKRSLDESAMLAVGILLEETISGLLGETGHLALVDSSIFGHRGDQTSLTAVEVPDKEDDNPEAERSS